MFEFLKGSKNHFIGIDFGTSSIKVVELSFIDQKASLENYGIVDLNWSHHEDEVGGAGKTASYEQKLNDALKELLSKMALKSGKAYVSIPGFSGLITIIEMPEMQSDQLSKAIQFEAHKYIPSSLDEIAMSWEIIDKRQSNSSDIAKVENIENEKKINVLLVAAPKREIERYDRLVSGSQLEVDAIELETFSIARSLVGEGKGLYFIIDIGSRATNIILVKDGVIVVNRNLDAGGNEITNAISESMNISHQRAEIFKKGEKDFLNTSETPIVIPVLELIASESRRILNSYKEKNKQVELSEVILSGGTVRMKGLDLYFSKTLGVKAVIGDPWKNISYDNSMKQLVQNLGGSFSVAIGLAMRGVEEYKSK